jgi:hypothetical protein
MPDGNPAGQSFEDAIATRLHVEESALAQTSFVTRSARFKPLHHSDLRAVADSYLLMAAADS